MNAATYRYVSDGHPAIERVSLSIRLGERVAIVGPSGAGKSTLLQVLLSFIQPQEGSVATSDIPPVGAAVAAWQ